MLRRARVHLQPRPCQCLANVAVVIHAGEAMPPVRLTTVAGYCGILTFVAFLVGIVFMATSGVQVLVALLRRR